MPIGMERMKKLAICLEIDYLGISPVRAKKQDLGTDQHGKLAAVLQVTLTLLLVVRVSILS